MAQASPATLPKLGSVYDLALAVAVLDASGSVPSERLAKTVLLGELALDGRVRRVRGILPAVLAARKAGWSTVVVPAVTMAEAGLVEGIEVLGARSLRGVVAWLPTNSPGSTARRSLGVPSGAVVRLSAGRPGPILAESEALEAQR